MTKLFDNLQAEFAEYQTEINSQNNLITCIKGAFGVKTAEETEFGSRYGSPPSYGCGYGRRTHTPMHGGGRMVNRRPPPRRRRMY
jgi:hypothetical protein